MAEKPPLNFNLEDRMNFQPDHRMIGWKLIHRGNGKLYVITGFCWLGASDEWGYLHAEWRDDGMPGVTIVRPFSHISGRRPNGDLRYDIVAAS